MERVANLLVEVDDRVAAEDEVVGIGSDQLAEQISLLEGDDPLERVGRDPGVALLREVRGERRGRGVARVGDGEDAAARLLDHPLVDVGAGDRDVRRRDRSRRDRRERERLGTVGAAGAPAAHAAAAALGELGQDLLLERLPELGVAPQLRDVDRHPIEEAFELLAIGRQHLRVLAQILVLALEPHERADPALHLPALVLREVDPADPLDGGAERLVVGARCICLCRVHGFL